MSFRGQLTKCPLEHVRRASSLESIAAGSWEAAIDDVLRAAQRDAGADAVGEQAADMPVEDALEDAQSVPPALQAQPFTPVLTPAELVAAVRTDHSGPMAGSGRQSKIGSDAGVSSAFAGPGQALSAGPEQALSAGREQALGPQQASGPEHVLGSGPVQAPGATSRLMSSMTMQSAMTRAREFDDRRVRNQAKCLSGTSSTITC